MSCSVASGLLLPVLVLILLLLIGTAVVVAAKLESSRICFKTCNLLSLQPNLSPAEVEASGVILRSFGHFLASPPLLTAFVANLLAILLNKLC